MNTRITANLTGAWAGELLGGNSGRMVFELQHDGDRIFGHGRFYERSLVAYQYDIHGISKAAAYSFFLTPKPNQWVRLGTIEASCTLVSADELAGQWESSIGTEGSFHARRVTAQEKKTSPSNSVFLVHGHDEATKEKVARFVEKLGLNVIILHEQVNKGMTLIEKFEGYASHTEFAIILFTPDDMGYPLAAEDRKQARARQNVVLEMGYFVMRLGRERVCVLYKDGVELPSDIFGLVYSPLDEAEGWKLALARELKAAGYAIDLNKIVH